MYKYLRKIGFAVLALVIVELIAGIVVWETVSPEAAVRYVYTAPWSVALWTLVGACCVWYAVHVRRERRMSKWALGVHLSLAVVMIGAFVTHQFSRTGRLMVSVGHPTATYYTDAEAEEAEQLPYLLDLERLVMGEDVDGGLLASISLFDRSDTEVNDFFAMFDDLDRRKNVLHTEREFAPSAMSPIATSGHVLKNGVATPNKPLRYHGWRFVVDEVIDPVCEEPVLCLRVNYDPVGSIIMLVGCCLLALCLLMQVLVGHRKRHHEHTGDKTAEHLIGSHSYHGELRGRHRRHS